MGPSAAGKSSLISWLCGFKVKEEYQETWGFQVIYLHYDIDFEINLEFRRNCSDGNYIRGHQSAVYYQIPFFI